MRSRFHTVSSIVFVSPHSDLFLGLFVTRHTFCMYRHAYDGNKGAAGYESRRCDCDALHLCSLRAGREPALRFFHDVGYCVTIAH